MKLTAMFSQSWRSIWNNKARSFFTILGIVIGIAAVIALVGLGRGLEANVKERFGDLNTTQLTVRSQDPERAQAAQPEPGRGVLFRGGGVETLTAEDYEQIRNTEHVAAASPEAQSTQVGVANTKNAKEVAQYNVNGVSTEYADIQNLKLVEGKNFTQEQVDTAKEVALIGKDVAQELFPGMSPIGKTIYLNNVAFTVVGIVDKEKSSESGAINTSTANPSSSIITGYKQWLELTGKEEFTTIVASVDSEENIDTVVEDIKNGLLDSHGIEHDASPDFTTIANQQLLDASRGIAASFTTTLTGIAAISLVVGGIGIMNIMLVTVTERTREIGLRRAVGAKKHHIMLQFLIESILLTLIGGGLGLLVGVTFATQGGQLLNIGSGQGITPIIDVQVASLALIISVVTGVVFGLFPAFKAAHLNLVEALRYE